MEVTIPQNLLQNRKVALGVTGSISIYKSLEIIRLLQKAGAMVKVVMSQSAENFIQPLTFEAISRHEVLTNTTQNWHSQNNHIDFTKECDLFLVAPCSTNTINKMASGIADNILLESLLASSAPIIIAPAANTKMLQNPITQNSLTTLEKHEIAIIKTQRKILACGDEGEGALEEPLEIFWHCARKLLLAKKSQNILITGGGTSEKIDDVRVVSNLSSGKMANALALASYLRGNPTTLISSAFATNLPKEIRAIPYTTSHELQNRIEEEILRNDLLIMAAAVSDFIPQKEHGKIKKENLDRLQITMEKNVDILKSIANSKIKKIGFKAELDRDNALKNAKNMLKQKKLDAVCLNIIDEKNGFGSERNRITFIDKEREVTLDEQEKSVIAFEILELAENL